MTDFKVNPDTLERFAWFVGNSCYGDILAIPSRYRDKIASPSSESLLFLIDLIVEDVRQEADYGIQKAGHYLQAAGNNLTEAAKWYGTVDRENAKSLDKTYQAPSSQVYGNFVVNPHPISRKGIAKPDTAARFDRVVQPTRWTGKSTNPGDSVDWTGMVHQKVEELKFSAFSPSQDVRWVVQQVLGVDPFAYAERLLVGDWWELGELSKSLSWAGHMLEDVGTNLERGLYGIQASWGGKAADAMQAQFQQFLYLGLKEHGTFCRAAGQSIMDCARAVYDFCQVVDFALGTIADLLAFRLLKLAGRVAEILKEVGEGTFEGIIYQHWGKIESAEAKLKATINGLHGFVATWNAAKHSGEVSPGKWPETDYRHPET